MKVGSTHRGIITGIKPYGAFVQLSDETIGLIHISEIKTGYIDDIYKELTMGQEVTVQVIDFDEYTQKPSFSMRSLSDLGHQRFAHHRHSTNRHKTGFRPLGAQLPQWLADGLAYLNEQKPSTDQ